MKNVIRILALGAVTAASVLSASAQTPAASPCTDLYTKWRENYRGTAEQQKTAYEAGKEYLTKCPTDEYVSYVQKWIPKYEAALSSVKMRDDYANAYKASNWPGVVTAGKQILAAEPENWGVLLGVVNAGLRNAPAGDQLTPDAIRVARAAMSLVETGKADALTPQQLKELGQFNSKGELISWLNYALGYLNFKTSPVESATYLVKAAQGEGSFKANAGVYNTLALAYQKAEYAPMAQDYSTNCAGKDLTDECKVKLEKLNLVVDRIIDAMARAVALADADPATRGKKAEWMSQLEGFYKFRHEDKTDGLNELVASIQTKPLLLKENQTLPTPAPTPTTTNATPSGNGTGSTASTGGTTTPTGTPVGNTVKPAATSTTPAKPAADTTPKPAPTPKPGGRQ